MKKEVYTVTPGGAHGTKTRTVYMIRGDHGMLTTEFDTETGAKISLASYRKAIDKTAKVYRVTIRERWEELERQEV